MTKLADAFAEQNVVAFPRILGGIAEAALGFAFTPSQRLATRRADMACLV